MVSTTNSIIFEGKKRLLQGEKKVQEHPEMIPAGMICRVSVSQQSDTWFCASVT